MLDLVLFQPEIPPNTGNVIRLCANTGTRLNLVRPLGFPLDDAKMRRAGLDYHEFAQVRVHDNWAACEMAFAGRRIFAVSTKGATRYTDVAYAADDVFVLGPETRGLPQELLATFPPERRLRLPMKPESRSLNLSNAAAVLVFEAWRQLSFAGGV
jgi:tRNA (cytidine/uridine-2'-O-)-methyltransferase